MSQYTIISIVLLIYNIISGIVFKQEFEAILVNYLIQMMCVSIYFMCI